MRLATAQLYKPRWSAVIHDEWTRNLLADRPDLSQAQLSRTRSQMDGAIKEAMVSGYESRIDALLLPDPNDRHVLAAAIESGATAIVTFNLKDFPAAATAPYGVAAVSPDDFVLALYHAAPEDFVETVRRHRASLQKPPKSVAEYLATLKAAQLPMTADALADHADEI